MNKLGGQETFRVKMGTMDNVERVSCVFRNYSGSISLREVQSTHLFMPLKQSRETRHQRGVGPRAL